MRIRDAVAFVTGANRGLGLVLAQELLAAGARKVYAAARQPERITLAGVERVRLDVTQPDTITAAARVSRRQPAHQQRWHFALDRFPCTRRG
jgi:NAD(P)-dependent dehydrogenase (short-subunit alcohol dehydrogenase family)